MAKKRAFIDKNVCAACGVCTKICPKQAIKIKNGCYAKVAEENCVGCRKCEKNCPAGCIEVRAV